MNYTPLYGNPISVASTHLRPNDSSTPAAFIENGFESVWADIVDNSFIEILPENFDALSQEEQDQVLALAESYLDSNDETLLESMIEILALQSIDIEDESNSVEDDIEGTLEDLAEDANSGTGVDFQYSDLEVAEILPTLFSIDINLSDKELYDFEAGFANILNGVQNNVGRTLTIDEIQTAFLYFMELAFPKYQPTELIAIMYLVASGQIDLLNEEIQKMVEDSSREDYLCSPGLTEFIRTNFGDESATLHSTFCEVSNEEKLNTLFGVYNGSFTEMLNLDFFDLIHFMLAKFSSYFDVIKSDTGLLTDSAKVFKNRVSETIDLVKKTPFVALEKPKPLVKTTADKSSNTWLYLGLGAAAAAIGFVVYKNKSNKGM